MGGPVGSESHAAVLAEPVWCVRLRVHVHTV